MINLPHNFPCKIIPTDNILQHIPVKVNVSTFPIHGDVFGLRHIHDYSHIWFVIKGKLIIHMNEGVFTLSPGEAAFIPTFTPHMIKTEKDCGEIHIISISFGDAFFTDYGIDYFSFSRDYVHFKNKEIPLFHIFSDNRDKATETILKISDEFLKHKDMSFKTLASLCADFFTLLCEDAATCSKPSGRITKHSAAIKSAIDYISTHRCEKLTIDKLCEVSGIKRRLFTSSFLEFTGFPCARFIFLMRLTNALHFLEHTTKSMHQISDEVGFVTTARLTHVLQETLGITPSEYRKLMQPDGLYKDLEYWKRWSWFQSRDFKLQQKTQEE